MINLVDKSEASVGVYLVFPQWRENDLLLVHITASVKAMSFWILMGKHNLFSYSLLLLCFFIVVSAENDVSHNNIL